MPNQDMPIARLLSLTAGTMPSHFQACRSAKAFLLRRFSHGFKVFAALVELCWPPCNCHCGKSPLVAEKTTTQVAVKEHIHTCFSQFQTTCHAGTRIAQRNTQFE